MDLTFRIADTINLDKLATDNAESYTAAHPYPYAIFENFLPPGVLSMVLREFPSPEEWPSSWGRRNDTYQNKYGSRGRAEIGEFTNHLIDQLNGPEFIAFLEKLTGIKGLHPDPELVGAGLHQITKGGYLAIHADFNKTNHRDRRLNFLLYLNENWEEGWGGHFEMWNKTCTHKERSILPLFNRCVIFNTDETSFHGHPKPLRCPPDRTRKSIALYYYTKGVREDQVSDRFRTEYVDTNWKIPPEKKIKLM